MATRTTTTKQAVKQTTKPTTTRRVVKAKAKAKAVPTNKVIDRTSTSYKAGSTIRKGSIATKVASQNFWAGLTGK